jgi:hypothetical protein
MIYDNAVAPDADNDFTELLGYEGKYLELLTRDHFIRYEDTSRALALLRNGPRLGKRRKLRAFYRSHCESFHTAGELGGSQIFLLYCTYIEQGRQLSTRAAQSH